LAPTATDGMAPTEPLVILWDDPHLLAVVKPAGLLTQGLVGGEPTLEDAVRRHLRPEDPRSIYLGTVHRLDRPVSGVVVWAKTPKAARRLSDQFAARDTEKRYWAVVEGRLDAEARWDDALGPVDESGVSHVVPEGSTGARRAITLARPMPGAKVPEGLSALVLEPETGRTHQLRAQTSARGIAVVGDTQYGALRPFPVGIALHARSLAFVHPISKRRVTLVAPVPVCWRDAGLMMPDR
jgi:23S rRNA pseudouridine1911/1915/1917 synthase